MKKNELEDLYRDAFMIHLIREGYSEFQAEFKARLQMQPKDKLI